MNFRTGFSSWSDFDTESRPLSELCGSGFAHGALALTFDPKTATPPIAAMLSIEAAKAMAWTEEGDSETGAHIQYCEILSPEVATGFPAYEAIPSWNTRTGKGSWATIELSALIGGIWSPWHDHGVWSTGNTPVASSSIVASHSIVASSSSGASTTSRPLPPSGALLSPEAGRDESGRVSTDTLILSRPAEAFRLRVRLFARGAGEPPRLEALSLAWSSSKPALVRPTSECGLKGRWIEGVPAWSQMIYPDGGKVWCSPTSLSMVMAYWIARDGSPRPDEESFIRRTVAGVYDGAYGGHGNWSFNAAWAGELGFFASVRRFAALSELETFIAAGQPVILSVSWDKDGGRPLSGAPVARSTGHLTTLLGFDAKGDPVMNEPAAPDDASVRLVYRRDELEARWLEASGGAAYILKAGPFREPGLGSGHRPGLGSGYGQGHGRKGPDGASA